MLTFLENKMFRREEKVSRHINVLTHYNDETLIDKNDRLIKIIKLAGIDYATMDELQLDIYKDRRNNLLKNFSSSFAFYFWEIRKKSFQYPEGKFSNGYAKKLNDKYRNKLLQTEMFHKELYLAIIIKQPEGLINRSYNLIEKFRYASDKNHRTKYLQKRSRELDEVTRTVLNAMSDYKPELLNIYCKNQVSFSAPLEFLSELLNAEKFTVPLMIEDAAKTLPRKRLFFNNKSGTIEIRAADGRKKFAAILSIKGYQPFTCQGLLNEFGLLNIEYVITQSFRPFDNQFAKNTMRDQQKDMMQSKDESMRQAEQIDEVIDETASGELGYGIHHFTLMCYADTTEQLDNHVATLLSKFQDLDITAVREDIACECGFWAQFPANFSYVLRPAVISTKNMAAFASFHNFSSGKISGNYWGDAVTVFETLSGSPYCFNFHYKDVGNFQVYGAMGSGKTVLVGFLIAQSMKFGGKRVIFDKDRGLEILVRTLNGVYEIIKPGKHTGFNPCQLKDTSDNRKFLSILLKKILTVNGEIISGREDEIIEKAVDGLYRLPETERQFCHLASFFGAKKPGSLRERFDRWHGDGANAWVFDNANDSLNLEPDVIGFDLGHILADPECKTPAIMYLVYRVEQAFSGERGLLFCDEAWLMLSDDYFRKLFENWSRTPRKKNYIFGIATQVANDTSNNAIGKAFNESSCCKILFPNPMADKKVYIDELGLTEHEYHLIKKMPDDKHYFLLIHGRGMNKESVILRLDLSGMQDDIAIISARDSSLSLLDEIRHEVGDAPDQFLIPFLDKINPGNHS